MIKTQKTEGKEAGYIEAVGRRKTSSARVRFFSGVGVKSGIVVNGRDFISYFPTFALQKIVEAPLKEVKISPKIRIEAKITGGGISSQAGAMVHGIARVLEKFQPSLRKPLKQAGFLKRDPRMKERRKFGLKKARKAPQWSKR